MINMTLVPTNVRYHRMSRLLELEYADGTRHELPCEYLRVYSPSAEVQGHGAGQEVLQTGKCYVSLRSIEPSGNYALRLTFDDGHDSGIYSWDYLHTLAVEQAERWQRYLDALTTAGASREPPAKAPYKGAQVLHFDPTKHNH